tara:strand:+ start:240 stop:437 length:198 start_codon:yes stop_codon:yes gene_type:complete
MEWKKELKDYIANNMSNKVSYKMPESLKKIMTEEELVKYRDMSIKQVIKELQQLQEKSNGVSKKN